MRPRPPSELTSPLFDRYEPILFQEGGSLPYFDTLAEATGQLMDNGPLSHATGETMPDGSVLISFGDEAVMRSC